MTVQEAINKVLDIARNEIGYREKKSNSQLDDKTANAGSSNYTKYARDLDSVNNFYNGKKQGTAWCDMFYDWLHVKAWGASTARAMLYQPLHSSGAGCLYSARYYMSAKQFHRKPKPGDQAFFLTGSVIGHTGIVETVTDKEVTIIEGNNGNRVGRHTYRLGTLRIAGYGRPNWNLAANSVPSPADEVDVQRDLKKGCKGDDVRELQNNLIKIGYKLQRYGADGSFGSETMYAVQRFQRDNDIAITGIVDKETYAAIDRLKGENNDG